MIREALETDDNGLPRLIRFNLRGTRKSFGRLDTRLSGEAHENDDGEALSEH